MTTDQCKCGCGEQLAPAAGNRSRQYVDDAHRVRHNRARARAEAESVDPIDATTFRALLDGLDGGEHTLAEVAEHFGVSSERIADAQTGRNLRSHGTEFPSEPAPAVDGMVVSAGLRARLADLPEAAATAALVASATALAAQLDARPGDSALWSRYLAALDALAEAASDHDRGVAILLSKFQVGEWSKEQACSYRADRYAEAERAGDEREMRRWDALVPRGCVRGDHDWHTWQAGYTACTDCKFTPDEVAAFKN